MGTSSDRRRAVAALAAERNGQGATGRTLTRAAVVMLLLCLIAFPVLWACGFFSTPRAVAEIEQLVDRQVAEYDRVARGEIPFSAGPSPAAMFDTMRRMPEAHREQAGRQMGRLWEARERAELASYFALKPEQRKAELDRRIKAEEARRQAWDAQRDQRRDRSGPQLTDGRGRGGPGGGPGGGGPGNGGRRGGGTEESRNDRSKRRIDRSTPEERARQAEYRRAIEERRTQLGLPTGGRRGG
jgi:hypothetical protein